MATIKLAWQGDRHKSPKLHEFRRMTRDEVLALAAGSHAILHGFGGRACRVKINGQVKTWKREPDRVEVPIKYGMYEHARLDLYEAMERLLVPLHPEELP